MQEFELMSRTNNKLIGYCWPSDNPIGNVIIAHGMVEHSLRYDDFNKFLNKAGYNVFMVDHIGHGKNQYLGKGVWPKDGFNECVDNIDVVIKHAKENGLPCVLIGHSMGSFMVQTYIQKYQDEAIKKVVLIGSSGPQGLYKLGAFVAKCVGIFANKTKPSKFMNSMSFASYNNKTQKRTAFDWLSTDDEQVDKYIQDEECGYIPSLQFFICFTDGLSKLHKKEGLAKINKEVPILIIAGKEDPVGNYGKSLEDLKKLYDKYGIVNELVLYDNMRHEILNEKEKEKPYNAILEFIKK